MATEAARRRLRFEAADVEAFARASGDLNPLHVDPEFAVGTAFGGCVAHGALVALAMLASLPEPMLREVRSLRVLFPAPVLVADELEVTVTAGAGAWELQGHLRGKTAVRVLARHAPQPLEAPPPGVIDGRAPLRLEPATPDPLRLRAGYTLSGEYEVRPELLDLAHHLGASALHPALLEGLAWSSYVVGMEIPGLHSLFAGLTLTAGQAASAGAGPRKFVLTVRGRDERTGRLVLAGVLHDGDELGPTAAIDCFALPAGRRPDLVALLPAERPTERRGTVALLGASRGFGASLAMALLARGFDVHGTYHRSEARAQELAGMAAGLPARVGPAAGRLAVVRCDSSDPAAMDALAQRLDTGEPLAGLVLNAALPPLGMGLNADSAAALAEYVAASVALTATPLGALADKLDQRSAWVLICSSAAVAAPPREWPHYVAAKGALEGLAGWLAASRPTLRTVLVRLPKMTTAMTATPSGRIGAAPVEAVAAWTAERLAGGELRPGLSVLAPDAEAVSP